MLKGFSGPLDNTHKVVSTVDDGSDNGNLKMSVGKVSIGFKSNSKSMTDPTTDTDDYGKGGSGRSPDYSMNNSGGASGDGETPGYNGSGCGVAELDGAQNNQGKKMAM